MEATQHHCSRDGSHPRVPKLGGTRGHFLRACAEDQAQGAWTSPRISVVALGSEDKPSSLKRQNLTLVLRMPIHLPEVSSSCLQNDAGLLGC